MFFTGVRYVREDAADEVDERVATAAALAVADGRPADQTERRQA